MVFLLKGRSATCAWLQETRAKIGYKSRARTGREEGKEKKKKKKERDKQDEMVMMMILSLIGGWARPRRGF